MIKNLKKVDLIVELIEVEKSGKRTETERNSDCGEN